MPQTDLYGLIGKELTHSFSPSYFMKKFAAEKIDAEYKAFPIPDIAELKPLLEVYPKLKGLNVTIPYKEDVIRYLDSVDTIAKDINAVNCIKIIEDKLIGYNTDIVGFEASVLPYLKNKKKALILGTGGAAKAVIYVLKRYGIIVHMVSRKKNEDGFNYNELSKEIISDHTLIVNTTPLGMYPDIDSFPPLPYRYLTKKHLLYDLTYNPEETKFLKYGKHYGAIIKNGLEMLKLQAEASWDIWQRSQPTV